MPTIFVPSQPYPKQANDNIRSSDWNAAINEVVRLSDTTQNLDHNTFSGPLTISGALTVNGVLGVSRQTRISETTGAGDYAVFGANMYSTGVSNGLVDPAYPGAAFLVGAQWAIPEFRFIVMDAGQTNLREIASIGTEGLTVTGGINGPITVKGNLTVTGALTASGGINGSITVKAALAADTALTVTGAVTVDGALTVNGALAASGGINGPLTVKGTVTVTGSFLSVEGLAVVSTNISGGRWASFGSNAYYQGSGWYLANTAQPGVCLVMSATGGGTGREFCFTRTEANSTGSTDLVKMGRDGIVVKGDKRVTTAGEFLYMVRGWVNANGTRIEGTGFTSSRISTGLYQIDFTPQFTATPAAVATQYITTNSDTRDNAVIVALAANSIRVRVGNGNGAVDNRDFTFIAVGPRTT